MWHVAAYEVWWDDEGEADEEEEADEDQEVGGEEGASQVSVVGEIFGVSTKWRAYSSCNCSKQVLIAIVVIVFLCNGNRNGGVSDKKDGGRDGGVELQEGGGQRECQHSHQGVREDEKHTLECLDNSALLGKHMCNLVLRRPFCE